MTFGLSILTTTIRNRSRVSYYSIAPRSNPSLASAGRIFRWSKPRCLSIKDIVYLEALDDGRLDRMVDRFTSVAGKTIPPAHPRTKIISGEPRHELALIWRWQTPPGLADDEMERLKRDQAAYVITEVWPKTPHPSLRRRTPLQAGSTGDSETFLRASIRRMETADDRPDGLVDCSELRAKLHLNPEPAIDPESVEIEQLHLSRLALIPLDRLDDDRLVAVYRQAAKWGLRRVRNDAARLIDQRPSLITTGRIELIDLYGELAIEAAHDGDRSAAEAWLARGRQVEAPKKRSANALAWEMIGLEVKMLARRTGSLGTGSRRHPRALSRE